MDTVEGRGCITEGKEREDRMVEGARKRGKMQQRCSAPLKNYQEKYEQITRHARARRGACPRLVGGRAP
ncbi:unnamed protein product [Chondrus crispus]|uniref:Uncharacterized protein n=1 Tax=Chondrus crispus TaxID=2769 RepID=R7QVE7_CHOCR|nr:unnamed protein product [Chondrus crispus]CDF41315.1 unnamed protein product [Chondrus crispus]|eukprot:XP_005711609.1 unnamed protein product [Chondrus crispus]